MKLISTYHIKKKPKKPLGIDIQTETNFGAIFDGKRAMTEKNTKTTEYKYLKLNELQANTTVNVFGVVKFARPPTKTRGSGKWRFFVDEMFFLCNIHVMPNNSNIGFIIIILVIG